MKRQSNSSERFVRCVLAVTCLAVSSSWTYVTFAQETAPPNTSAPSTITSPSVPSATSQPATPSAPETPTVQSQQTSPEWYAPPPPPPCEPNWNPPPGFRLGADLVVPIFLESVEFSDRFYAPGSAIAPVSLDMGIGFQARVGWEFANGLMLSGVIGGMGNVINHDSPEDLVLVNGWIGVDMRYSFWSPSILTPFLSGGLTLNMWDINSSAVATEDHARLTLGMNFGLGTSIELSRMFGLDIGMRFHYSWAGSMFNSAVMWVTPFIGGTVYWD